MKNNVLINTLISADTSSNLDRLNIEIRQLTDAFASSLPSAKLNDRIRVKNKNFNKIGVITFISNFTGFSILWEDGNYSQSVPLDVLDQENYILIPSF